MRSWEDQALTSLCDHLCFTASQQSNPRLMHYPHLFTAWSFLNCVVGCFLVQAIPPTPPPPPPPPHPLQEEIGHFCRRLWKAYISFIPRPPNNQTLAWCILKNPHLFTVWSSLRCFSYPFLAREMMCNVLGRRWPSLPHCVSTIKPSPDAFFTFVHSLCSFKCIFVYFVIQAFAPNPIPIASAKKWVTFAEDFERLIYHLYHCLPTIKPSHDAFSKIHICSQSAAPCVVFPSFSFEFLFWFY